MRGDEPCSHVGDPRLLDCVVAHRLGQVVPPGATQGHEHIQARVCAVQIVLRVPVEHDESLVAQFALENAIHEFAVLAAVRVVDPVVGAHDGRGAGSDAIHKRPEVVLVERLVINIGRNCLHAEIGAAICFLLVGDEVLNGRVSLDPREQECTLVMVRTVTELP